MFTYMYRLTRITQDSRCVYTTVLRYGRMLDDSKQIQFINGILINTNLVSSSYYAPHYYLLILSCVIHA